MCNLDRQYELNYDCDLIRPTRNLANFCHTAAVLKSGRSEMERPGLMLLGLARATGG